MCWKCISSKDLCRRSLIQVLRQLGLTGKCKAASEVCGGVLEGSGLGDVIMLDVHRRSDVMQNPGNVHSSVPLDLGSEC